MEQVGEQLGLSQRDCEEVAMWIGGVQKPDGWYTDSFSMSY